jgi:hypothetical protein
MNNANSVRPIMKQLGKVAERNNCAILLVGHLQKKGSKSQYRSLGSIDIYAAARSVITVGFSGTDNVRVAFHNKSNLESPGLPQGFNFDSERGFTWLGDYDITIDELLGGTNKAPRDQLSRACNLIKAVLINGPVTAVEIILSAEDQGISEKTLKRAKSALGVISVKRGEKWFWEMPIEVEYEADQEVGSYYEEGQVGHAHMAALTHLQEAS